MGFQCVPHCSVHSPSYVLLSGKRGASTLTTCAPGSRSVVLSEVDTILVRQWFGDAASLRIPVFEEIITAERHGLSVILGFPTWFGTLDCGCLPTTTYPLDVSAILPDFCETSQKASLLGPENRFDRDAVDHINASHPSEGLSPPPCAPHLCAHPIRSHPSTWLRWMDESFCGYG